MMVRYYATALSLKAASATSLSRRLYRSVGNIKNSLSSDKTEIPKKYFFRSNKYLEMLRTNRIVYPGMDVLELGTGWVHWEALMLRLELPTSTLLYDIWDNRSWERFKSFIRQLSEPQTRAALGLESPAAGEIIDAVAAAPSIEAAYDILNFRYIADDGGLLRGIESRSRDLVISSDVGEHLQREHIQKIIARTYEILRPGGWAYHQIVLTDHLKIYAPDAHPKQYLKYSRDNFDRYLNNKVQYINCIQIPEWIEYFRQAGFDVTDIRRIASCDTSDISICDEYRNMPKKDLDCTVVQFMLRKPLDS